MIPDWPLINPLTIWLAAMLVVGLWDTASRVRRRLRLAIDIQYGRHVLLPAPGKVVSITLGDVERGRAVYWPAAIIKDMTIGVKPQFNGRLVVEGGVSIITVGS